MSDLLSSALQTQADRNALAQEIVALRAELEPLRRAFVKEVEKARAAEQERDEALANFRFMVERAADQKLDGYREMGRKLAALEEALDRARRDRRDALSVTSREGLLASEWVARTGKAERERDEALKILKSVEWNNEMKECPWCLAPKKAGHAADCDFAAAMRGSP